MKLNVQKIRKALSQLNERRHALAHWLGFNFRRRVFVKVPEIPYMYDVQEECSTCKSKKRLDLLAVEGCGNITFFTRNGREDGYTCEAGIKGSC